MSAATEDTVLIGQAMAYVIELYREISDENGAPTLGTQNQVVDFIRADPELRAVIARWGRTAVTGEATTEPIRRLPCDAAYRRVAAYMRSVMEPPVFARKGQNPR